MENQEESQDIVEAAGTAILNLLPTKSRNLYDKAEWCKRKKVQTYTENVMLAYLHEKSNEYKSSMVWAQYSFKIVIFEKKFRWLYKAKKSKILTRDQIDSFLSQANDDEYLMIKIALIFGISGACRGDELTNLRVDDIEDVVLSLIITIPNTKTKISRTFVVTRTEGNTNILDLNRKYAALRPPHTSHGRFFVFYKSGKCIYYTASRQKHFWKNPKYNIHLPRIIRSNLIYWPLSINSISGCRSRHPTIKRHGGWKSTTVAEGYIHNSVQNKTNISN
ncbi:hypothetical protein NQ317_015439 [Molorchus minor]|uniref:Tyr recombinase domain-containing protein n=1 Tax=Molorchus minor TaxID=1323400 RepID=A0ABQ9J2T7_9CUCU|nr:hypothetical protein NQ317_015439 [Molorchus minor]